MNNKIETKKQGAKTLEWFEDIVFASLILILIFSFLFRIVEVNGTSMVPTLQHGERLLVWGAGYSPNTGDVVVVSGDISFNKALVKRIIAKEGDIVNIDQTTGDVYVNNQKLTENYINEQTQTWGDISYPVTVPEGTVFVMGDNRNNSEDSRYQSIGFIEEEEVLGQVVFRIFPLSNLGVIK